MKATLLVVPFLVAGLIGASAYAGTPAQTDTTKTKTTHMHSKKSKSEKSTTPSDTAKTAGKTVHHGKHHPKK